MFSTSKRNSAELLLRAWEHGLVVRRFCSDVLVPYQRVKAVQLRSVAMNVGGVKVGDQFAVSIVFDEGKTLVVWPMSQGAEAAVEIAARAGVKPGSSCSRPRSSARSGRDTEAD